jgi:hypothetical protein
MAPRFDAQRFLNRSLPQTLQTGMFLLYLQGGFLFFEILVGSDYVHVARLLRGGIAVLVLLGIVALDVGGGYLTAQERKVGYLLAITAAAAPFLLNLWLLSGYYHANVLDRMVGGSISSFNGLLYLIWHGGILALFLHPMSRNYARIWFK